MATKTISLHLEAYERLRSARRYPSESFTQVILRARWPGETITAADLLERSREAGAHFSGDELDRIETAKLDDRPPVDKWRAG